MSDLPKPQDAAEAAQFAEYWDAVLSYADLCTAGSAAAARLATEAFARGGRETGGAGNARTASGPARRPLRLLPRIPLLLTAVRATAASWEATGQGDDLTPDFRLWLNSPAAARHTGPPSHRPLALRALRDMQPPDAELLWLAEVEALPLPVVARRLGLDPATVTRQLAEVRRLFWDRCRRAHADGPADDTCRHHARLLDPPGELPSHVAGCAVCAEAAGCLRTAPGSLAAALADGVIGWGGLAYLERRRRAAEVRLAAAGPAPSDDDGVVPGGRRTRVVRGGLLTTAALISLLALTASLRPWAGPDGATASGTDPTATPATPTATAGRQPPAADPAPSATAPRPVPDGSRTPTTLRSSPPDPEPVSPTTTEPAPTPTPAPAPAPASTPSVCRAHYDLVNQWPAGFQATVTVTTTHALDTWQVSWTFPDTQRITQIWDATQTQTGPRVTVTAAAYNAAVPAGGTLSFGFLASWEGRNGAPREVSLNGVVCAPS